MATVLVALGANLGDRGETLDAAIQALAADPHVTLLQRSGWYVTDPVGGPAGQPQFMNAAARLSTTLSPSEFHQKLIEVEQRHGRVRVQRWGARKLDLDLLLYDELILDTPQLTLPHPRMSFRRFVLGPAYEVAAEMRHPVLDATIDQLWQHLTTAPPTVQLATLPGPAAWQLAQAVQRELAPSRTLVPPEPSVWPGSAEALSGWLEEQSREGFLQRQLPSEADVTFFPWWGGLGELLQGASYAVSNPTSTAPAPRLIVHWERPEVSFTSVEAAWWSFPRRAQLAAELAEFVAQRVSTPLLSLRQSDAATAVTEIAAAVQAMQ